MWDTGAERVNQTATTAQHAALIWLRTKKRANAGYGSRGQAARTSFALGGCLHDRCRASSWARSISRLGTLLVNSGRLDVGQNNLQATETPLHSESGCQHLHAAHAGEACNTHGGRGLRSAAVLGLLCYMLRYPFFRYFELPEKVTAHCHCRQGCVSRNYELRVLDF